MQMFDLSGKTAIVTGGNGGIGLGMARGLASAGANIAVAARNADKLVVGLNGDASVRRLKGAGRPTQSAELRSAVLAALPFVDAIAVFDEDTPFDLIATLQPDIIVKGGDYIADQVVGADIVAARGGQVLIISTLDGHATSKLITT